jgi:heavy metal sensor kinase
MRLLPASARARLAVTYALTVMILIALYSGSLYYLYRADAYSELNKKLRRDFETMEILVSQAQSTGHIQSDLQKLGFQNFDSSNWLTEVWSRHGERIFTTGLNEEFLLGPLGPECEKKDSKDFDQVLDAGLHVRVLCSPSESLPDHYVIRTARLTETISLQLRNFFSLMAFGMPLTIVLSGLAGYFLARKALQPIQTITAKAKAISVDKLNERLPVENPHDELGLLAQTFNETFERLEKSFTQMRQFTGDASHELRTPLSAIRTLGEVALRTESNSHRDTISEILEQTDRLQSLCESLLLLSRADAGSVAFRFEPVSFSQLVQETVHILEVLAEDKKQSFELSLCSDLTFEADPNFLKQAIMNLVDNAIKYSPETSIIRIQAFRNETEICLSIKDQGIGIPQVYQTRIFDRFYRTDQGRTRNLGGAGLGLSICQWIVSAHHGRIELISEPGNGSEFILRFPTPTGVV